MSFFLILLLFISIILLILSIVFPLSILSVLLQSIFALISILVLRKKWKSRSGYLPAFLLTIFHTLFLLTILYSFFTIALPQKKSDDMQKISNGVYNFVESKFPSLTGILGLAKQGSSDKSNTSSTVDNDPFQTINEKNIVEDPF